MPIYLVQSPQAEKFLTLATTDAGRRSQLGDAKKYPRVSQQITDAHETLRKGVERVTALPQDRTRTDVARHAAAKQIAENTAKQLAFTRNNLATKAEDMMKDGAALADAFFEMRSERSAIDAKMIEWVQGKAQTDGGIAQIRKAAMENPQLAAVVYQAPDFLLGINPTSQQKLRFDVIEKHAPEAFKAMMGGNDLSELVPRFDKAIASVHSTFYNPAMAEQAASRVDVA